MNDLWNLTLTFNNTYLIQAVEKDYIEIVELLLKQKRINIDMNDILDHEYFITFKSNFFHDINIMNNLWN